MKKENTLSAIFVIVPALFILLAFMADGIGATFQGFIDIQIHPARLINDFIEVGGIGGTLLNAAVVGIICLILVKIAKVKPSGPIFAAFFTLTGFAFLGKTGLNILPIPIGVWLSAKFAGKTLRDYIIIALFGTALAPLVTTLIVELGFSGVPALLLGLGGGIAAGFLLPALAITILNLHQGYNLYNMGFTCGFLGLFLSGLIKIVGKELPIETLWNSEGSLLLNLLVPILSLSFIILSLSMGSWKELSKSFKLILKSSGRLPSDFMYTGSVEGALFNAGLVGIAGSAYVFAVGSDFTGPVLGGLLTIIGFGAFGTHLRNSWSIVLGVSATALIFGKPLSSPGPILAVLFSTTLAPLAGEFGHRIGFIAGFIHFVLVNQTADWHGGINLYNNGFSGGLTATIIISMIHWYKSNRREF